MKRFTITLIIFVIYSLSTVSIYSQQKINPRIQNQFDSFNNEITLLKEKYKELEVNLSVANQILNNANKIIEYSGWIGIGVTALILLFTVYSFMSFNSSRKEIKGLIKEANKRLTVAEEKFKDFIDSPEAINNLLDDYNFKQIEKEIDDANEKVFIQGLNRANTLTSQRKQIISKRIKPKLYDPPYWMHFSAIYEFLKFNSEYSITDIAAEYFDSKSKKMSPTELYFVITDLFKIKPYRINPFKFYKESKEDNRQLVLSHLNNLLEAGDKTMLVDKILSDASTNSNFNFLEMVDQSNFTKLVAKNLKFLGVETVTKFTYHLEYNEEIFKQRIYNFPNIANLDPYVSLNLINKERLKILVDSIKLDQLEHWIDLFNLYSNIPENEVIEVLQAKYNSIDPVGKGPLAKQVLELCKPNYGIRKDNSDYYYLDTKLKVEKRSMAFNGQLYDAVIHPILNKVFNVLEIN
jgi:hypothetical protein